MTELAGLLGQSRLLVQVGQHDLLSVKLQPFLQFFTAVFGVESMILVTVRESLFVCSAQLGKLVQSESIWDHFLTIFDQLKKLCSLRVVLNKVLKLVGESLALKCLIDERVGVLGKLAQV